MPGMAQKLFMQQSCTTSFPWKSIKQEQPQWPLLEAMVHAKRLGYVDLALAQRLLNLETSEALAALICHLSLAARQGHLCVVINGETLQPDVESVWIPSNDLPNEGMIEISERIQEITQLIKQAVQSIPASLLHEVTADLDRSNLYKHSTPVKPLCKNGDRYYLQRYWVLESQFLNHLVPLICQPKPLNLSIDLESLQLKVSQLIEQKILLQEQGDAVMQGCLHPLTVITGGPGTGKTHTAGILLRVLWEGLTLEQRQKCRVGLAAPTGKAAANLEGSIRRATQEMTGFPAITAETLHSLLGVGRQRRQSASMVLPYDVLLVDECSMIDARVMGQLVAAIKPGSRLIMLGDRYQLPPVEAGSLFSDLVALLEHPKESISQSLPIAVSRLTTCLRAELRDIVDLAALINDGNGTAVQMLFKNASKDSGIKFTSFENGVSPRECQRHLLAYSEDKFPVIDSLDSPKTILKEFSRFRILSPLRKGPLGVEALNGLFLQMAIKKFRKRQTSYFIAPIMIIQNDYRHDLFNGEVGLLIKPLPSYARDVDVHSLSSSGFALFPAKDKFSLGQDSDSDFRKIPAIMLPKYEYAYCLSVHKSQGSEFDHVVMLLPEGSEHFGREVLYTGATRARKALEIWSTPDTLNDTMDRVSRRQSGVIDRMNSYGE